MTQYMIDITDIKVDKALLKLAHNEFYYDGISELHEFVHSKVKNSKLSKEVERVLKNHIKELKVKQPRTIFINLLKKVTTRLEGVSCKKL